jgi:hypothetical protein
MRHAKRPARGQAMIELIIVLPIYVLLFFSVFLLGDMMWMNLKVELAARYASWKRVAPSTSEVRENFFEEIDVNSPRLELQEVRTYRHCYPFDGEGRETALQQRQITGGSENERDLAHICFEGGDNHYRSFKGVGEDAASGGWVKEQRAVVNLRYNVVGFRGGPIRDHYFLRAGSVVLEGKLVETKLPQGDKGEKFAFRDEDPTTEPPVDQPHVSGEEAGMIDVFYNNEPAGP